MEYLLAFPFHAVDPNPWPPIEFLVNGTPITIRRPIGIIAKHADGVQLGNEEADAYCTIIRLSTPTSVQLSTDDGWKIVKRLLEWIRVKWRHYWLLHGIGGFGATYRGTLFVRDGGRFSQQNIAVYGPNVIVNPLTLELWSTLPLEMENNAELPLADSIYCDSLLSIVAGDTTKALLEAGVAMEVALTKLLVDVSKTEPSCVAKSKFIRQKGDRQSFGIKLCEWTKKLALQPIESFTFDGMPPKWHETVREVYKLRNGVAHGGQTGAADFQTVVKGMFAASALLQYCRMQRLCLGLSAFSMPANVSPYQQVRFCHNGHISTSSNALTATLGDN